MRLVACRSVEPFVADSSSDVSAYLRSRKNKLLRSRRRTGLDELCCHIPPPVYLRNGSVDVSCEGGAHQHHGELPPEEEYNRSSQVRYTLLQAAARGWQEKSKAATCDRCSTQYFKQRFIHLCPRRLWRRLKTKIARLPVEIRAEHAADSVNTKTTVPPPTQRASLGEAHGRCGRSREL